ncbi:MAG TPA: RNA polymerase sigma factor [Kofleriaceae bacterium]|nr:RNA polymerase sigma factor [Kofleriaceae bacterium]
MNDVIDSAWMDRALRGARPRALAALLRYFRELDVAEEAFQEACLQALTKWPLQGPPRDPAAWLILVGRNSAIDSVRRRSKHVELVEVAEDHDRAAQLDDAPYRDDILRLLFICCHPELPATEQIALALRLVCGLSVEQIARAFVVGDAAMEQRITRAKKRVSSSDVAFETPGAPERASRLAAVAAILYLMFNEGYAAHARAILCDEAIRLARLLLHLFSDEPGIMGLLALMLLQHARSAARLDPDGEIVLLEDQDRSKWDAAMIAEGLATLDKALRHRRPDTYQVQAAIAALHARAARAADTDWSEIERLYARLEQLAPSPVVTLNRAVAVSKVRGPAEALAIVEPLAPALDGYFYFHGLRGALLLQLRRDAEARASFDRAIARASTAAEAAHIRMQLDRLQRGA